jgi:hypothetical protein
LAQCKQLLRDRAAHLTTRGIEPPLADFRLASLRITRPGDDLGSAVWKGNRENPRRRDTKGSRLADEAWPEVTEGQRAALEEILTTFLALGEWPNHAYLDQQLHDRGFDLDAELATLPERLIAPDSRRSAGGVFYQDGEQIGLMARGLAVCRGAERQIALFIACLRWAVERNASLKLVPNKEPVRQWPASEAIEAMEVVSGDALGEQEAMLIFEVMRWERDLPTWSGIPADASTWVLYVPREIRGMADVRSMDDYLEKIKPRASTTQVAPIAPPSAVPGFSDPYSLSSAADVIDESLTAEARARGLTSEPEKSEAQPPKRNESRLSSWLQTPALVITTLAGACAIGATAFGIYKWASAGHHQPSATSGLISNCGSVHAPFKSGGRTFIEREYPHSPVKTFIDCHGPSGVGMSIAANQVVRVYCRVFDVSIPSVEPGGYWYRIASPPWNGKYWSPANTFLNGDPPFGPYRHPTDLNVPKC